MLKSLGVRLFGTPPAPDALKSERLRYIRGLYIRPLPLNAPVLVFAFVVTSNGWLRALLAATVLMWLQGLISISLRIRRAEAEGV